MANLVASIDKVVDLKAEFSGETLQASLDQRADLSASMDFTTNLLAEFGVGFSISNATYLVDKNGNSIVDKTGKYVKL